MDYLLYDLDKLQAAPEDELLLDSHESEQYAKRGEKYLITRALLKKEIARRLHTNAADITFSYNEHGKPFLTDIHFNISHSANMLCFAFHRAPIGVDIQQIRPVKRMQQLASRIMSPPQWKQFRASDTQETDFFTCWCIAEALVKLHGSGIWYAEQYPYRYENGRATISAALPSVSIHLFSPAPGFCGAIAMEN